MGVIFQFPYRTVAEVSLSRLVRNLHNLRGLSRQEVIPVVKADAYGHGMVAVARALISRGGAEMLAVATLEEALELRRRVPHAVEILVLSGFFPHQLDAYFKYHLIPVIHCLSHLKSLIGAKHLPEFHLKLDTGMNRLGIKEDELGEAITTLEKIGGKLAGIATHFADAETTSELSDLQLQRFEAMRGAFLEKKLLATDARIHVSNSAGLLRGKLGSSNAVRPGISLYGILPTPQFATDCELLPVLEWKTRIVCFKDIKKNESVGYGSTYTAKDNERVAVLPIGYADGYRRQLGNEALVLVNKTKMHVRGRISMDLTSIDVTGIEDVKEGLLVTLMGGTEEASISAWDLSLWANTVPYEILCGISARVPRVYLE